MFSRVLLHGLEAVVLASILVLGLLEEFTRLLAHLQHPLRRKTKHLRDSGDLIVLGRSWEQR